MILQLVRDEITTTIPLTGGNILSNDGDTILEFPSGAFTDTVVITYTDIRTDAGAGNLSGIGHTYEVNAVYKDSGETAQLASGESYTLTITYTDTEITNAFEQTLALYYWDEAQSSWIQEPTSDLDMEKKCLTVAPNHLSLWTVMGVRVVGWLYLPIVIR